MVRGYCAVLILLVLLSFPALANAENYVALGTGLNLPSMDTTDSGNLELGKNPYFGGKIGHYFNDRGYNWFGLELDMYRSSPGIKQQTLPTTTNPALSGKIPGADLLVHSLAFNALVRVTGYQYKVEPYAGMGIGLNVGNISSGTFRPEASFAPSFNVLTGIRYYVTDKIAPFVEYKYNFAQFSWTRSHVTADYRANLFMFGIAFHYDR